MDPKFALTPKSDAFNSYTLTVKFTYHRFPISYDFHLEPIPSPQEFVRDNVIKPLLFASLRMTKQLDEVKASNRTKIDWSFVDPSARDVIHSSRDPYQPINGIGASLLEAYFRLQLEASVFETAEVPNSQESQALFAPSSSQPTQGSASQDVKFKIPTRETWRMDLARVDSQNKLDLRYDSVLASMEDSSSSDTLGNASSSQSSSSVSGPHPTTSLPLIDQEMLQREELEKAAAIQVRIDRKKRKREAIAAQFTEKRPVRFL